METQSSALSPHDSRGDDGYLTIHGLRHHYIRWGDPRADPVVFLHGLMNNARYWEPVVESFLPGRVAYAPDLRGHGESEHAPGGYLVWAFAMDLRGFVEEFGFECFDLVAHSAGSRVAIAYAREHSHRIEHLVLADQGPEVADSGRPARARTTPPFATEAEALEHFAGLYPGKPGDFLGRLMAASLVLDESSGGLVFRFDPAVAEATGKAAMAEIPYLWESLEHITCPTLVVRSQQSRTFTRLAADEMARRLPRGRVVEIPGSSNDTPLDEPARFAAVVRDFLAE